MTAIDNIRAFFANRAIQKLDTPKANAVRFSFATCKNIGIIYSADNATETRAAVELYNKLKAEGKQVSTLGYFNYDRKKATIHPKLGFDYFYKSDLTWQLAPANGIVDTFINTPFNLVIDLSGQPVKPLEYVVALSKAATKAGLMRNSGPLLYDFMIGGISNENIDTFAAQLIYYLKLLNT